MTTEKPSTPTKLCPTCGTRLAVDAARCLVCGAELGTTDKPSQPSKVVQASQIPSVTLSIPVVLFLLALFLALGAVMVYFALRSTPEAIIPPTETATMTVTLTPTATFTPVTPTLTFTPEPSPTPLTYYVKENDTCLGIAAFFGVSVQSIVTLNNLPAKCDNLYINQPLLIPHPTATPTPLPSATLGPAEQTEAACEKVEYIVKENDTLSGIASAYGLPMAAIQEYNGLPNEAVYLGQTLIIPLCRRFSTPGPSPTPTPPPPYPAPNLLLPPDGAPFTRADEVITLQWASVGVLRENEAYMVSIEDVTAGNGLRQVNYVTDTKFIVPATLQPVGNIPHVFRWKVSVVRQTGTDNNGKPLWTTAGAESTPRVFTWSGSAGASPTP